MRHRARVSTFGRKTGPRKALIRGLVVSLVEHGRIKTTLAKAKELRRHAERAVTLGKRGLDKEQSMHMRRLLMSRYPNENTVTSLMNDLAPHFKTREGGYTRILKLGQRPGDRAEMAYIEFVDYKPAAKVAAEAEEAPAKGKKAKKADADVEKTVAPKTDKRLVRLAALKKKRIRKSQQDARKVLRG